MHNWGSWPDDLFDQIGDIAAEIGDYCVKHGRISVMQTKEKYGTVRVYCHFGWDSLYAIFYPRHCWVKKWWPYRLDLAISNWLMPVINKVVVPYQIRVYRTAYRNALIKYPHLYDEIISCADFGEALEGVEGYKHSDYWTEVK
jgi:hypothetical protein